MNIKRKLKIKVFLIHWLRALKIIPDIWYECEIKLAEIESIEMSYFFSKGSEIVFNDWYFDKRVCEELKEHNRPDTKEENLVYPCQSCEEEHLLGCSAVEFNPDHHYCGKNHFCMP